MPTVKVVILLDILFIVIIIRWLIETVFDECFSVPLISFTFKLDIRFVFFLVAARVLVGNTVQGNSTMRVAPPGFDTTGDGQNIFGNEKKRRKQKPKQNRKAIQTS